MKMNSVLKCVVLCFGVCVLNANGQTMTNLPSPPPGYATRIDYLKSFTNEDDAMRAYRGGLISKDEFTVTHFLIGNQKPQDFYGKAIDQYGQPVVGAAVTGYLRTDEGYGINDEKVQVFKTRTDASGLFEFTGIHGARFGQKIAKDGYEMGQGDGFYVAPNDKDVTSPEARAIFKMWKLKGPEPMVHPKVHAYIPCDGTAARFDLLSGKRDSNGSLIVSLKRDPLNIDRRHPFNWTITLDITNGGFEEITNLYPNEAPPEGYQQIMSFDFPTNSPNWQPNFNHSYYFMSDSGQVFGLATIDVQADFQPSPTYFGVDIYANPAGSRNLEFDYKKQIR